MGTNLRVRKVMKCRIMAGWPYFVRKEEENPQILRNNYTYARNFYQFMLCFQRGLQTCLVIFQVSLITPSFLVVFLWNLLHSAEAYSIFPSCSLMCRDSKTKKLQARDFLYFSLICICIHLSLPLTLILTQSATILSKANSFCICSGFPAMWEVISNFWC